MPEPKGSQAGATATANMNTDAPDSDSEPSGFPLTVDLSPYMGAPARCRVWVRARSRKVRWLASRVRRAARLRGPLLLMAGECLLPPGEPLRVIQADDILSVARVEHNWQRPFSFHEDEDAPTEPDTVESTSPANLSLVIEPTLEKHPQPAKQKHITLVSPTIESPVKPALKWQHTPTTEETSEEPVPLMNSLDRVKQRALALLQDVSGDAITEDVVDAPKKKRRRVRRRRPCKDVNIDFSLEAVPSGSLQNIPQQSIPETNQEPLEVPETDAVQNESADQSKIPSVESVLTPSAVRLPTSVAPSPTILTYPPPSVLVRNPTPPRAPRVVRALTAEPLPMEAVLASTN